ncbi:hypothetical protein QBC34DRAFT_383455 [Podospora aff. communis PSN243]|uniref:Cyanovirin-N domain-containing protein n=1 Tax=Podospora aff. communis PSN243 TaxID=3040156 RepID=A0AAV9GCW5_9PEZI|nr:hypothetical protein QBC34DRAFT_383455 [Podospora aff. communis PSN243]
MKPSTFVASGILMTMQPSSVMADRATILSVELSSGSNPITANGIWHTNAGNYAFNAGDGCREDPGVPNIRNLCVDWRLKRAEWWAFGAKRCFLQTGDYSHNCYGFSGCLAVHRKWDEVKCNW